ncbi:MAG: SpoIIE family protein phosphatase [Deltaproteobacteria bacterium]|nr:SpoIIE family protein phosphatase [Deltaproteobacteria bacterium]
MKVVVEHRTRPCPGEQANGDAAFVRHDGGSVLLAVVDALGHGPNAAAVTASIVASLKEIPLNHGVESILAGLHNSLRGTRGAAALVCVLKNWRMEGAGVGNVELRCAGPSLPIRLSAGILGSRWPRLNVFDGEVMPGHRLVLFSDGISRRFTLDALAGRSAAEACALLLERHASPFDDATVMVADLGG